jgi:hypothetical protein
LPPRVAENSGDAVTVAYLHGNTVAYSWHKSLLDLIGYDLTHHQRVIAGGWMSMKAGTGGIVEGRNDTVTRFLAEKDSDWLWWVDDDMGFAPDTVDRLLAAADPVERPVVGGLCFAYKEMSQDGWGGARCMPLPTIFDWVSNAAETGFAGRSTYPVNEMVRCAGTGSACLLVHRSVFERIEQQFGPVWYDRWPNPSGKGWISEDLSFCMRVGAVGVPLYVHTGVRTTHAKMTWVAEEDYWAAAVAPPATEHTAVIVPVLGRPQNAAPFMASLRASTGLATVYAIADPDDQDTAAAWTAAGATVLHVDPSDRPGTFAEKVNLGYRETSEPWLFLVGDDVRFYGGWLDHAQAVARDGFDVIGTADMHNPRVMAGEHGTHLLIRRAYVDEQGASWDGPKVVAHEGYRHWFVDNEIVTAAKQRGAWAPALGSVVEHLHPLWGGAADDDTYRLGAAHADCDRDLFGKRLAEHADD